MLTIREAEEILKKEYHIDNFTYVVNDILLPDFVPDKHEVLFNNSIFNKVTLLGASQKCEVNIYEVILNEGAQNRRVKLIDFIFDNFINRQQFILKMFASFYYSRRI